MCGRETLNELGEEIKRGNWEDDLDGIWMRGMDKHKYESTARCGKGRVSEEEERL